MSFRWCERRDLNPYGITTRPSNVRVCRFRHSRIFSMCPSRNVSHYIKCIQVCQHFFNKIFKNFKGRKMQVFCTSDPRSQLHQDAFILSLSLSAIIAINSEFVGFPLEDCIVYPKYEPSTSTSPLSHATSIA